jgi:hypothetical protein
MSDAAGTVVLCRGTIFDQFANSSMGVFRGGKNHHESQPMAAGQSHGMTLSHRQFRLLVVDGGRNRWPCWADGDRPWSRLRGEPAAAGHANSAGNFSYALKQVAFAAWRCSF